MGAGRVERSAIPRFPIGLNRFIGDRDLLTTDTGKEIAEKGVVQGFCKLNWKQSLKINLKTSARHQLDSTSIVKILYRGVGRGKPH